jgi:hypothetical protein
VSEKNSKGLGDRVANFTKKTGIDKLVHAVVEDCGCEERQKKLNALFPGRNVAMDPADVKAWEELLPAIQAAQRGAKLKRHDTRAMYDIYNRTFNANAKPCSCTGKNKAMVEKLERAYEYSCKV